MKYKFKSFLIVQLVLTTIILYGQGYKVEYNKLQSPLFKEDSPIICILEKNNSLFTALGENPDFINKFTCYSSEVIAGLKDALQVDVFDAEDKKFQQALKEQLSVGYILDWETIPDSEGVFQLDIFSTENNNRIYSNRFYPAVNSTVLEDAKKLIVENMEPSYILPYGELAISGRPETIHFKLIKGDELVKEWTGKETQKVGAGKYKLVSEADNYISEESEVEISEDQTTTLNISLKPQLSSFISVRSLDGKLTNIRTDVTDEQVKITYDLVPKNKAGFKIGLEMINQETGNKKLIKMVSGDVDEVKPGTNKIIYWQMLKELGTVPTNNIELQLSAEEISGIPWYYYAGGGAALLGGAAVLLLGGGGNDGGTNTPPAAKIGIPPGRP